MTEKRPQSYQQLADILETIEKIHTEAGRVCRTAGGASDSRTRHGMVAETFAEGQEALAALLAESREQVPDQMRATWIQYVPTDSIDRLLDSLEAGAADPERLPAIVVELQNAIARLLDVVRGESPSADLAEFLDAITGQELSEAKAVSETLEDMDQV